MSYRTSRPETPLTGRSVVITGGASGIGLACAQACGHAGANVALLGLGGSDLDDAVASLRHDGVNAWGSGTDIREFDALETAFARAVEKFGDLDAVVASAGVADWSSVLDGDPERWRAVIETNLLGSAYTVRVAAPYLAKRGHGDIVLISSISGRESYIGEPVYIASKWGTVGLGHAVRHELEARGVRVCLVEPGLVDTPLTRSSPVPRSRLESGVSLRPEDVASAVLWVLCQPDGVSVSELVLRAPSRDNTAVGPDDV
jgi:NADP-dependent 3-hydroxy acid dehydrogenase YdfG